MYPTLSWRHLRLGYRTHRTRARQSVVALVLKGRLSLATSEARGTCSTICCCTLSNVSTVSCNIRGISLWAFQVKGTYSLYKAAARRFPLQIDTRTKRQQMVHIFRDGRQKRPRRVQLQDYHLRTVPYKFGRGANVIASVTSGPHSHANGERRPTLEVQSHLSSCTCPLRRERGNEDSKWFKHSQKKKET